MKFTVQDIVEAALFVALGIVLGLEQCEIPIPPAGHISLQFVPLVIIALRFNPVQTFMIDGICFGALDCLLDSSPLVSYPLEYLLALGFLFFISLARNYLFVGHKNKVMELSVFSLTVIAWTVVRFLLCSIDGVLVWGSPDLIASMTYNAPNIFADGAVTLVVMLLLYLPIRPLNARKYKLIG